MKYPKECVLTDCAECSLRPLTPDDEDLLAAPLEHLKNIWKFLQVPETYPGAAQQVREKMAYNPGAQDHASKAEAVAKKVARGTHGNWETLFTEHDRAVFKALAGETLLRWGYVQDQDW